MGDALSMTPRRAAAWLYHAELHRRREMADKVSLMAMASRGDPRELRKTVKDLSKDIL